MHSHKTIACKYVSIFPEIMPESGINVTSMALILKQSCYAIATLHVLSCKLIWGSNQFLFWKTFEVIIPFNFRDCNEMFNFVFLCGFTLYFQVNESLYAWIVINIIFYEMHILIICPNFYLTNFLLSCGIYIWIVIISVIGMADIFFKEWIALFSTSHIF